MLQMFEGIPKVAIIAVVILALLGALWFWNRWRKSSKVDKETENVRAQRNAAVYAKNVAVGLSENTKNNDREDDHDTGHDDASIDYESSEYDAEETEVDYENDDEEYEPMD